MMMMMMMMMMLLLMMMEFSITDMIWGPREGGGEEPGGGRTRAEALDGGELEERPLYQGRTAYREVNQKVFYAAQCSEKQGRSLTHAGTKTSPPPPPPS